MISSMRHYRIALCGLATLSLLSLPVNAQARTEITINDVGVSPENLTSSRDGAVFFGSTAKGTIYRAAPGASQAEPWILASSSGLTNVLGLLADDRSNTLWVCQNVTGGRGTPVAGQTALRSFDLKSGNARATYPFPPNAGICNDIAVGADGTAYVTESFRGRVHRLRPGAAALEVWVTDSANFNAVDGVAVLSDGSVYVNDFFSGKLFRIRVSADGSAGSVTPLQASMPSARSDGLRSVGRETLVQAEGQGRLSEIQVTGDRATVRVLQDGLTGATGVTVIGDTAFVLVNRAKAVAVPYHPR